MSLPVSALSELELMHYSAIDESARIELVRRCGTSDGLELYDRIADLEAEVAHLQQEADDDVLCSCSSDEYDSADLLECIQRVRRLLKDHKEMDQAKICEAVEEALKEMGDFH